MTVSRVVAKILVAMKANPKNVRFSDLCRVCDDYLGAPRQGGGSHRVYSVPLTGQPPINIQEGPGGKAKTYQVRQVLRALVDLGVKE